MAHGLKPDWYAEAGGAKSLAGIPLWPGSVRQWASLPHSGDIETLFPVSDFEHDYCLFQPWSEGWPTVPLLETAWEHSNSDPRPTAQQVEQAVSVIAARLQGVANAKGAIGPEAVGAVCSLRDVSESDVRRLLLRLRQVRIYQRAALTGCLKLVDITVSRLSVSDAVLGAQKWWYNLTGIEGEGFSADDFASLPVVDPSEVANMFSELVFGDANQGGHFAAVATPKGLHSLQEGWLALVEELAEENTVRLLLEVILSRIKRGLPVDLTGDEVLVKPGPTRSEAEGNVLEIMTSLLLAHTPADVAEPDKPLRGASFDTEVTEGGSEKYVPVSGSLFEDLTALMREVDQIRFGETKVQSASLRLLRRRVGKGSIDVPGGWDTNLDVWRSVTAGYADRLRRTGYASPAIESSGRTQPPDV